MAPKRRPAIPASDRHPNIEPDRLWGLRWQPAPAVLLQSQITTASEQPMDRGVQGTERRQAGTENPRSPQEDTVE